MTISKSMHSNPATRRNRSDMVVLILLIGVLCVDLALISSGPQPIGQREDDGVYLATAKALADGRGYRHAQLPGEPWQTKYPVLYPLALSAIWRMFPEFPGNVSVVQVFNALCAGVAGWMAYLAVRRIWRLPAWMAGAGIILALTNPGSVLLIRDAMSEHLYAALSWAALAMLGDAGSDQSGPCSRRTESRRAIGAALLAGLAFLTRSIGVCVLAAVVVAWVLRRRWRPACWSLLIAATVVGGWQVRQWFAHRANEAIPQAGAFGYDLDYGHWLGNGLGPQLWVLYHNISGLGFGLFATIFAPPGGWALSRLLEGFPGSAMVYGGIMTSVGLCAWGLATVWHRSRPFIHGYLLIYLALVWFWPYQSGRFLIPLLPVLAPAFLVGLVRAGGSVVAWFGGSIPVEGISSTGNGEPERLRGVPPSVRSVPVIVLCVPALLLAYYLALNVGMSRSPHGVEAERAQLFLADTIRRHTPADAVIGWYNGGYFHLATGRKIVPTLLVGDPVHSFYPPDRRFSRCGLGVVPGQARAYVELLEDRFEDYRRAAGITHVVELIGDRGFGSVFHQFLKRRGYVLRLVIEEGPIRLHRLDAAEVSGAAAPTGS